MDDKVKKILELQEEGTPRKEIYKILGYKEISSLNRFMKRKGFILDGELFVNEEDSEKEVISLPPEAPVETSKDDKCNINIINKEEAPEDMINIIPEGFKENMINLVNQYDKLQEVLNWFNTKDDIDNTVIEVTTGIKIDLPEAPIKRTTIRVNEKVWNDFISLAEANSEFDKHSLLSMAIKEYTEKYNK